MQQEEATRGKLHKVMSKGRMKEVKGQDEDVGTQMVKAGGDAAPLMTFQAS